MSSFPFLQSMESMVRPYSDFLSYTLISLDPECPLQSVSWENLILLKSTSPSLHAYTPAANVAGVFLQLFWNKSHVKFITISLKGTFRAARKSFLKQGTSGSPLSLASSSPPMIVFPSLLLLVLSPHRYSGLSSWNSLLFRLNLEPRAPYPVSGLYTTSRCWPFKNSCFSLDQLPS